MGCRLSAVTNLNEYMSMVANRDDVFTSKAMITQQTQNGATMLHCLMTMTSSRGPCAVRATAESTTMMVVSAIA